jgi:hypothetical protein
MPPSGTSTCPAVNSDQVRSTPGEGKRLGNSRIHNGQRTPGPSPPVATTRDEDAVDKHGSSVANELYMCAKTLMLA